MTDKDPKKKNNSDDVVETVDTSVEPELLGVELSEELKKAETGFVEEVAASKAVDQPGKPLPKIDEKEFDLEVKSEVIPPVPKKEFSMEEQSKHVEEIVDTYIPNPTVANSVR